MSEAFKTETIEHAGQAVRIEYFYDDTYSGTYPWSDCCGQVDIQTKPASYYGHTEKSPSEVIFHTDRHTVFYYDIREAHKKARDEGWGCSNSEGLTKRQIAARAVAESVEMWRGWLNDEWFYAGVVCTVLDSECDKTENTDSCWGFETFNDYHETVGREMAIALAERAAKESEAVSYWASRDVRTVDHMGV